MQLYQPYEQKMQRLAEIKAKILRYKYLILACLLFVLAGISTLLYFKGTIRKDIVLQPQYTYGDTISYEAKAFMADTKVVFYQNGEEIQTPKRPGTYTARVVARGAFGIKKYGEMQTFTIVPKQAKVSLLSQSYTYGETPTIRVDGLIAGDAVDEQNLRFICHDVLGVTPTVQIAPDSFAVYNGQEENVTDCYDFQDSVYSRKSVVWTKRYVSIKTGSITHVYDGNEISCPQYDITLGSLANGDVLQTSAFPSLRTVGQVQNSTQFTVINGDGVDVSKMYAITKTFGVLKITPRPLTITTEDRKKVADGQPFDQPTYQVSGLADGHSIVVLSYCTQTQPGNYKNFLQYDIQTQSGESVKENYAPTETWGDLIIYASKITVKIKGESTYNGREVTNFSVQIIEGALLYGESFIATKTQAYDSNMQPTIVQNAGVYTVEIAEYQIQGRAEDAPEYLVELQAGTYTVKKRPITVTLTDAEKYYDRTPLTSKAFTATNTIQGHRIEVTSTGSITEPGTTTNVLQDVNIYDANNQPVTDNYQITKKNGVLTVRKRKVTISPLPISKTYDGLAIAYPDGVSNAMKAVVSWTNKNDPLQDGNALLSGDYADFVSITFADAIINVGTTDIIVQGACIKYANGDKDNGKYYDVTVKSSTAIINPVQIEIYSLSHKKIYDGTPLTGTAADCYINKGGLVGDDTVEYVVNASQTTVGTCKNLVVEVIIKHGSTIVGYVKYNANGELVQGNLSTYNYQITVKHGTLEIASK